MTKHLACKTANTRERAQQHFGFGSLLLTFILMQQLQQELANRQGGGHYGVAATPIYTTTPTIDPILRGINSSNNNNSNNNTLRLKRYSDISFMERFQLAVNSTILPWNNTCGSPRISTDKKDRTKSKLTINPLIIKKRIFKRHEKRQELLNLMQKHIRFENSSFIDDDVRRSVSYAITDKSINDLKAFDYREMNSSQWNLHRNHYRFLPRLRWKSKKTKFQLKLRNIHNDLEFYVAAFSYLRTAQFLYDFKNSNHESVILLDLDRLRLSARSMLCNVDTTIWEINRIAKKNVGKGPKIQIIPLMTLTKSRMETKLEHFKTKVVDLHKLAELAARDERIILPPESTQLDLDVRFVKYSYIQYMNRLIRLLDKQRRKWLSRNKKTQRQNPQKQQQQQKQQ